MGNLPSTEAPRKAPQKLSKPRPVSRVVLAELPSTGDLSTASSSRYCNSYLAGSRHPPPHQQQLLFPAYQDAAGSCPTPTRRLSRQQSVSHEPQPTAGEGSNDAASSTKRGLDSRASSVVYPSAGAIQPLTRAHSLRGFQSPERHLWVRSDAASPQCRQLSNPDLCCQTAQPAAAKEIQFETCPLGHVSSASARLGEAASHPGTQDNINALLYIPMRRRSLIQKPGVATRAVGGHTLSPQPSIQTSRPTPASQGSFDSVAHTHRRLSLPPDALRSHHQDRPITPCETDYRQLGGMKFGTLRITNGSIDTGSPTAQRTTRPINRFVRNRPAWLLKNVAFTLNEEVNPDDGTNMSQSKPRSHDLSQVSPESSSISIPDLCIHSDAEKSHRFGPNEVCMENARPSFEASGYPSSSGRQSSLRHSAIMLAKGAKDVDCITPEILDVRQDPNAKSRKNSSGSVSSGKSLGNSMASSDSGFVSASTSSSRSSRIIMNKAKDGYGPDFPLRTPHIGPAIPEEVPQPSMGHGHSDYDRSKNSILSQNSPISSRDKAHRISKKSGEKYEPASSRTKSAGSSETISRDISVEVDSRMPSGGRRKQGKLRRFLRSTKMQIIPTAYVSHDISSILPAVPADLKQKLDEHTEQSATVFKPITLRMKPSQPKSNNSMSTDSLDLAASGNKVHCEDKLGEREPEQAVPFQLGHYPNRAVAQAAPSSLACAVEPSWNKIPRVSIKRKPVPSGQRNISGDDGEATSGSPPLETVGDTGCDSNGANATDPRPTTVVHDADASPSARARGTLTNPTRTIRKFASQKFAPGTPVSAPASEGSPTMSQCASPSPSRVHESKLQSTQAHGLITSREQLPSQAMPNSLEVVSSLSRNNSPQKLRRHPPLAKAPDSSIASARPQSRRGCDGLNQHPPLVYRQPHSQDRSESSRLYLDRHGQQYRTLHSYNSPAYKNVPVWG